METTPLGETHQAHRCITARSEQDTTKAIMPRLFFLRFRRIHRDRDYNLYAKPQPISCIFAATTTSRLFGLKHWPYSALGYSTEMQHVSHSIQKLNYRPASQKQQNLLILSINEQL